MRISVVFLAVAIGLGLGSCGGGDYGGGAGGGTTTYTVGGTLTGLASGTQVTLENNGTDSLTLTATGSFTFATPVTVGASYSVTVRSHSLGQACSVAGGSGVVPTSNVTYVAVTCMSGSESVLYSFGPTTSTDGQEPLSPLMMDTAGNLYGTTAAGGVNGTGAVFKITPSGTESFLYSFGPTSGTDAQYPTEGGLLMDSAGNLYGTTRYGGATSNGTQGSGNGAVFKLTPSGTESVLYSFGPSTGTDGQNPVAGLITDSAGNLYGTTSGGGANKFTGTVFKFD